MPFLDENGVSYYWQKVKTLVQTTVPTGMITMWSGSVVPDGWALCDGQNGTPDLRGRFVLGASTDHSLGTSGGSETVALTIDQIPEHSHTLSYNTAPNSVLDGYGDVLKGFAEFDPDGYSSTDEAGGSEPHSNMPPYYVLAYIMKT